MKHGCKLTRILIGMVVWGALSLSALPGWAAPAEPKPGAITVYFGTYTGGKSKGIYQSRLDTKTGVLRPAELVAETASPSFLALHPGGRYLYAVSEISQFNGKPAGAVSAFAIDREHGRLQLLNQQPSGGAGPCHLAVDATGRCLLVANYGGGSVAALPIRADGGLEPATAFHQHQGSSVNPRRQQGPHAHCVNLDSANRFLLVADLGLDQLLVYRFDPVAGTLRAADPPSAQLKPGSGPRHVSFHPDGRHVYLINELDCTVSAFAYDPERGRLEQFQSLSTLPGNIESGYSTAEILVHPSGKFLYGSNRGHDSIAVFRIDPASGRLTFVQHEPTQGRTPRNFAIDPSGAYLLAANQDSDRVVVFRIDPETGRLSGTGQSLEVPKPVCVIFLAAQP